MGPAKYLMLLMTYCLARGVLLRDVFNLIPFGIFLSIVDCFYSAVFIFKLVIKDGRRFELFLRLLFMFIIEPNSFELYVRTQFCL